jgi:hypothetical protein
MKTITIADSGIKVAVHADDTEREREQRHLLEPVDEPAGGRPDQEGRLARVRDRLRAVDERRRDLATGEYTGSRRPKKSCVRKSWPMMSVPRRWCGVDTGGCGLSMYSRNSPPAS